MILTSLSHVLLHGKRHPWFQFSSVIVLLHCHFFWSLCFVAFRFVACFALFPYFKYFNWCSPFFILKFICCQFAACLFFGISLIKYFLFSPLSPWLLTLLPTLTIVCCGKFLLVEFFFPSLSLSPPPSPPPFLFFYFTLWKPQFHFAKELCQQRDLPPHVTREVVLPTTSTDVAWIWHQWISEICLNIPSGGFFCLCVCLLNKCWINSFCLLSS